MPVDLVVFNAVELRFHVGRETYVDDITEVLYQKSIYSFAKLRGAKVLRLTLNILSVDDGGNCGGIR